MKKQWLLRYSEIFLKSDPVRRQWEKVLIANIRAVMPDVHVKTERGRIWLEGDVDPEQLKNIFGIVSFSEVEHIDIDDVHHYLPDYCRRYGFSLAKTFAVRIKRVGTHPFTSNEKAIEYGNLLRKEFPNLKVNLAAPDKEIFIEIREHEVYLYDHIIEGSGGLPIGVEGTLVALISGGIDSPVAAWRMMKRGCRIVPLFIALDTFLDESTISRARRVVDVLKKYQPDIELTVISDPYLAAAKEVLNRNQGEKYTCLICKRRMYRIAEAFAKKIGAKGIVTGESIGQVASQTVDNLFVLNNAVKIPIYRPLIGFDKDEIISVSRKIGTFEPSISHVTGCKAVPKRPSTSARLEKINEIESILETSGVMLSFEY